MSANATQKSKSQLLRELRVLRKRLRELESAPAAQARAEQAERELRREREIFMRGPVVVFRWLAREDWPVEYVSPNVEQFGYRAEELMSGAVRYADLVHPDDLPRVASEVEEHSRAGRTHFAQRYRLILRGGVVRWVEDHTVVVRDRDGRITHYDGYVFDITDRQIAEEERRQLEAQVQHAQKLESLGILAGGIAHDFNNLLTGILGNAALALDALPADSPVREAIAHIAEAAHRAAELTRQMLAYSGKGRFTVTLVNLSRLVDEMTHLLRASISKKAVLECRFADRLAPIEADAGQIQQVVMNLIMNASEALGDQRGVIRVQTGSVATGEADCAGALGEGARPAGSCVFLEVSDTGCGMDAQTQAKMFDPFFTTKFTGRGLGLAAVLGIVRGHRGAIRVVSNVGQGTAIRVLFPAASRVPLPTPSPPTSPLRRGSGTVLVVDDEDTVRVVARASLARAGFTVLTAANGQEALDVFRRHAPEIAAVVLDLTMPQLSGDEVLRELKQIRPEVPVILSSGYSEQDSTERFAGAELAGFIQKPYRPSALVEKVVAATER